MKTLYAYIRMMRPLNLFQGAIALLVAGTLMNQFPDWTVLLLAVGIVWSYTGAGNALNDFYDAEIDKINRPGRPIPQGLISKRNALLFSIVLFVIGTLWAIPLRSLELVIILVTALLFLITYSMFFKMRPLLGNAVVSFILGMTFLFAASVYGDIRKGVPPFILAFGFNLIREIVKDMQDVEGDSAQGARTLPLRYGIDIARRMVYLFTFVLMLGCLVPYMLNIYGKYYLLTLIIAVEIPLIYFLYSLHSDNSAKNCARLSSFLKGDIFFGLLAIFLGRF